VTKIHAQNPQVVWETSSSLSASANSGSFVCHGYGRLVGMVYCSASTRAASGLRIRQSADRGINYDYWTDFVISEDSGSAFSIELVGNVADVVFSIDNTASAFRSYWQLRAI